MSVRRLLKLGRKKTFEDYAVPAAISDDYVGPSLPSNSKCIRLVKFEPESLAERRESSEGPLRCKIQVYLWDSSIPAYGALSYVWGSPGYVREIICNDRKHFITSNLEEALRSVYRSNNSPYIWCDQLCVNQSDLDEKSAQVGMMTDIFRKSEGVQAHLGDLGKEEDYQLIHDYANWVLLNQCGTNCQIFGSDKSITEWEPKYKLDENPDLVTAAQRTFLRFIDRDWFHRGWMVQEASAHYFNMTYAAGDTVFRNVDLLRVANFTESCLVRGRPPKYKDHASVSLNDAVMYMPLSFLSRVTILSMNANRLGEPSDHKLTLQQLLEMFSWCQTSDPRDKIYSLLSLASDRDEFDAVDYRLPAKEIFYNYWITLYRKSTYKKVLSGLSYAASLPELEGCPSWARDLGFLISPSFNNDTTYSAGGKITDNDTFFFTEKMITLGGYVIDEVESVAPVNLFHWFHVLDSDRPTLDPSSRPVTLRGQVNPDVPILGDLRFNYFGNDDELVWISELVQMRKSNKKVESTEVWEDLVRDLGALVMLDGTSKRFTLSGREDEMFALFARAQWDPESSTIIWPDKAKRSDINSFALERYLDVLRAIVRGGQRLFMSKSGRVGLCNAGASSGDKIIIIKGACMPFIMRNNPDYKKLKFGQWELISEAYVRGIMFGEVMPRHWHEISIV